MHGYCNISGADVAIVQSFPMSIRCMWPRLAFVGVIRVYV